jgi:hypothetical protein
VAGDGGFIKFVGMKMGQVVLKTAIFSLANL